MICANVQNSQKKIGYITSQNSRKTPWNKLCVDLIGHYKIRRKGKYTLILKAITRIDPVTLWFEVTQYRNKKAMTIANLVKKYVAGLVPIVRRDHV